MATQPFEGLTPEQYEVERRKLAEQADALEKLRAGFFKPETYESGIPMGSIFEVPTTPAQIAAASRLEKEGSALKQQQADLEAAIKRAETVAAEKQVEERFRAIKGEPPPAAPPAASPAGAYTPADLASFAELAGVGQKPAEPATLTPSSEQFKTVIASRRDPATGRVIFETQRVPVAGTGPSSYEAGIAAWQDAARAREAGRNMATTGAGFQVNPQGFAVRDTAGGGGFSPSRGIGDVMQRFGQQNLLDLSEAQLQQESPALQDLVREAQDRELARQMKLAGIEDVATRRRLGTAEAGLAEEKLKRAQHPEIEARERMALAQQVLPEAEKERASAVVAWVQDRLTVLKAAGQPVTPQVEQALKLAAEKAVPSVDVFAQRRIDLYMSGEPAVAAARARIPSLIG